MARPKKQINRRIDILDAARKLFLEKGVENTTMDEIARSVGISKGSIYLDFKNKEEIHIAIVKRHVSSLIEQLENETKIAQAPYLDHLNSILINHVLTVFDMAMFDKDKYATLIHTSYQIKLHLKDKIQKWHNLLAALLVKAVGNGEIQQYADYSQLAHLICVSLQGFFPPYDLKYSPHHRNDLSKQEVRELLEKDVSMVVKIIIAGIKSSVLVTQYK